jgi:hypothetical protein
VQNVPAWSCGHEKSKSAETGCQVEDIGIWYADNPSRAGILEIDYRLTAA